MSAEPDWMVVLRAEVARTGNQAAVARAVGYSASVISQVLKGSYRGNLDSVELAVRGRLMDGLVTCPALGPIRADECNNYQRAAETFTGTNAMAVRMFRACRKCPLTVRKSYDR